MSTTTIHLGPAKPAQKTGPAANRMRMAANPATHPVARTLTGGTGPRVYSYIRFSSLKQANGTSIERQMEYAVEWAARHGMTLDTTLTDEGRSGWKGEHVKKGALGAFLRAIEEGNVAPGSVLIVEALDRLSREEPIIAQAQLTSIVMADVRVVTAKDNNEYSREALKKQPEKLLFSVILMIQAHSESEYKSDRVRRAMRARCQAWKAGTFRGNLRAGHDPAWVTWTGERFELNDSVHGLREAIGLYQQGYGPQRIFEMLESRGIDVPDGLRHHVRLYEVMRNRALIGERRVEVCGETFVLEGYYPAMMDVKAFEHLQLIISGRGNRRGGVKGAIPQLFTGIRLCKCGHCGWSMVAQNMVYRMGEDRTFSFDSERRIRCGGVLKHGGCRSAQGRLLSASIVPLERALMQFCADQINLDGLRASDAGATALASHIAKATATQAKLEAQAKRLTDALADGTLSSKHVSAKLREVEQALEEGAAAIMTMQREHAALAATNAVVGADTWIALIQGVRTLDYDARMTARRLVADTFSNIVVYIGGATGTEPDFIDMELVSRQGVYRYLRVNRITGDWVHGHDLDMLATLPIAA